MRLGLPPSSPCNHPQATMEINPLPHTELAAASFKDLDIDRMNAEAVAAEQQREPRFVALVQAVKPPTRTVRRRRR